MLLPCGPVPTNHLVVLFDDALRRQRVVLQVSGQVEHVLCQLLLEVVVVLQDGVQLRGRLAFIERKSSGRFPKQSVRRKLTLPETTFELTFCFSNLCLLVLKVKKEENILKGRKIRIETKVVCFL